MIDRSQAFASAVFILHGPADLAITLYAVSVYGIQWEGNGFMASLWMTDPWFFVGVKLIGALVASYILFRCLRIMEGLPASPKKTVAWGLYVLILLFGVGIVAVNTAVVILEVPPPQ